jgi:CRP-like cAMP-binding protein
MVSPELLRRFACFSGATEQSLKQVAMLSEEKSAAAGEVLFREGQVATHLYIVVDGEVDIQYVLGDGSHQTVDTLIAGDFMMWSSLVEPHTTHSDAPKFLDLLESEPALGFNVMKSVAAAIAHRLHGTRLQIAAM